MTQRYSHGDGRFDRGASGAHVGRSSPATVFIAIQPPAPWQVTLAEIQTRLSHRGLHKIVAWLNPDHFHLSLRYLGDARYVVPTPCIVKAITPALARAEPFDLHLGALGIFLNRRGIIVQAGAGDGAAALEMLKHTVERALAPIGYEPETDEFNPHVTLGRVWGEIERSLPSRISHLLDLTPVPAIESHDVRRVSLIHSSRESGKPRYILLATVPIGPYD